MCTVTAVQEKVPEKHNPKRYSRGQRHLRAEAFMLRVLSSSSTESKDYIPDISQLTTPSTNHIPCNYALPIDNFFTLSPYEIFFIWGQDAQRVLLTCPGFSVNDVRALVHIDCTLWQSCGLWDTETHKILEVEARRDAHISQQLGASFTHSIPSMNFNAKPGMKHVDETGTQANVFVRTYCDNFPSCDMHSISKIVTM